MGPLPPTSSGLPSSPPPALPLSHVDGQALSPTDVAALLDDVDLGDVIEGAFDHQAPEVPSSVAPRVLSQRRQRRLR